MIPQAFMYRRTAAMLLTLSKVRHLARVSRQRGFEALAQADFEAVQSMLQMEQMANRMAAQILLDLRRGVYASH